MRCNTMVVHTIIHSLPCVASIISPPLSSFHPPTPSYPPRPKEEQHLVDWAAPFLDSPSRLNRIMDPALRGRYSVRGAQTVAAVARECVSRKSKTRPRMSQVVAALQPALGMQDMAGFTAQGTGARGVRGGGEALAVQ